MNPWHDVNIGEDSPDIVRGIIEIPKNSRAKYRLCKKTGNLKLDKVLFSSSFYPANYGFIPKTYCDDKDPLDILILSDISIVPLCVVTAKVIGVMRLLDGTDMDDKIIAVAQHDSSVNHYNDISELPDYYKNELKSFFDQYKKTEQKTYMVEEFQSKEVAKNVIIKAIGDYRSKFV